ncbi:MAG: AAA family ATPase [Flavobacteriales bacterium]|nr:MAG: AAA family ATPase [Flavobacteriales bacterium]
MASPKFTNPFRPGAGHPPPYLAGREEEKREFEKMLEQDVVLDNLILTGLRGVGKTVLLETFKPIALKHGWLWAGTDLSESATVSEHNLAIRVMADLAPLVTGLQIAEQEHPRVGFKATPRKEPVLLSYELLESVYTSTPGLVADKLKAVLELVWHALQPTKIKGIILAYDEAQNLSDQAVQGQYPLSLLLEVFQSLQKKGFLYMLVLTGLPTLFPKLVEARTFAERMFHVTMLDKLNSKASREAIQRPIQQQSCPVSFEEREIKEIISSSGGYPYFIQFICRECFDSFLQQQARGVVKPMVSVGQIVRKLDSDFYAGRWNKVTDRQRELLSVIAGLKNANDEFSVQQIVERASSELSKGFSPSQVTQMLSKLSENGLVFKNRHGRYSFAVPLLGDFIQRQMTVK